ncbi:MAG: amidase [Myxococcota bacterium]
MTRDDTTWLGVEAIQTALAAGATSARALADATLARVERLEPSLSAWSALWPERVRARADALDREAERRRSQGLPLEPLHGVGVALKDLCDVAGEPTRAGTTVLGDPPAQEDAEVVRRLEAAGAIVLGKVKMTEGAFVTHHPSIVPPVNPWRADRWTGISSSGSGVAVAAGLCVAALGTDTGGSIRFPSSACGLSGLKPTHGRVSLRGVYPLAPSLDHVGPMARSVDDAARVFAVLAGHDPRDPWSLAKNPPLPLGRALLPRARGQRIGYDARHAEEGVDPEVVATTRAALEVFRSLGAEIVELALPDVGEALGAWVWLGATEIAEAHAEPFARAPEAYGPELRGMIEQGLAVEARQVARAWQTRLAFARRLEGVFEQVDALLAPVIPGRFAAGTNLMAMDGDPRAATATRFTSPFNLSGSPALTLCGGFDADGGPIGFQLVGRHLEEDRLLALGRAYQSATDWHLMHPDA